MAEAGKKKHVKKLLKRLKIEAEKRELEFVSGRGHRKQQYAKGYRRSRNRTAEAEGI